MVSRFSTVLDFGGRRLAFTRGPAPKLVAAAYTRHGIAAYDPYTGEQVWTRRDIKGAQHVTATPFGLAVGIERGALHLLDDASGETLSRFRGTCALYAGDGRLALAEHTPGSDRCSLIDLSNGGEVVWKERFLGFALLDAAVGRDAVAYTEAGSLLVQCHELDGRLRWRWVPPTDVQVERLAWLADGRLAGVLRIEQRTTALIVFGPDGSIESTADVGGGAYLFEFSPDARSLLVSRENDAGALQPSLVTVPEAEIAWEFRLPA